ncbi:MAG: hypothetical protein EBW55_01745 [Betaproteobacteria bacterium]|nr:hypothetical protein [Betaproteobacteria bacterium]
MESNQSSMVQAMQSVASSAPVRRIESTELRPESASTGRPSAAPPAIRVEPAVRVDLSSQAKAIVADSSGQTTPKQSIERQVSIRKAEFTERALVRAAQADQSENRVQEAMSAQRMEDLARKEKVQAMVRTDAPQPKKEVPVQQDSLYL